MDNSSNHYLKESEQIKITDLVREHAKKANETTINNGNELHPNLVKALKVSKYIYSIPKIEGYTRNPKNEEELQANRDIKDKIFRKRTLHEVLEQGIYPTCSDTGLVFRGLMIALDVPTKYVEAFHEDYLFGKSFSGHVVGRVLVDDEWYFIDPQNNEKRISKEEYELFPLIIFREGLDSWDIGIRGYDDMHKLKKENIKPLMDKYKDVLKIVYEAKIKRADEIKNNSKLSEIAP